MVILVNRDLADLAVSEKTSMAFNKLIGAPDKVRTRDPLITNQVLYQLSYKGSAGLITQAWQKKSQKAVFGEDRPPAFGDLQHLVRHA